MIKNLRSFRIFLGPEVWRLFVYAVVVGLLWFSVESCFAYVLQGFLSTIGLIPKTKLGVIANLYPDSATGAVALLMLTGLLRATVVFLRYHTANITAQAFIRYRRFEVLRFSLENTNQTSSSEAVSLFNDRIVEAGRVIQNFVSITNLVTAMCLFSFLSLWITPIEFLLGMSLLAIALLPVRKLNTVVGGASKGILTESRLVTEALLIGIRNNFLLTIYGEVKNICR